MNRLLDCVEINPENKPASTSIIWLHGLGANGHDFVPIVPELKLPAASSVRFVFPHAPARAVTINNGFVMPAWFDISDLERLEGANADDIETSVLQIVALLEREHERGIEYSHIILAGFSQGGVIALHCAARFPQQLGGILALSTYLPLHETLREQESGKNKNIPVYAAHGIYDPVIPVRLGRLSHELAKGFFPCSEWHEYAMEHSVCLEEIQAISRWLERLPALTT